MMRHECFLASVYSHCRECLIDAPYISICTLCIRSYTTISCGSLCRTQLMQDTAFCSDQKLPLFDDHTEHPGGMMYHNACSYLSVDNFNRSHSCGSQSRYSCIAAVIGPFFTNAPISIYATPHCAISVHKHGSPLLS